MADDFATLDAVAQAALVRAGEASPLELVDAAIARVERVNDQLNAVIHERFERARTEARGVLPDGPLRGVPLVLKDLDGYLGDEPYHAGTRHLRDLGWRAPHDSNLTRRFRDAGLVVIGRTNTPELGLQPTTEPVAYGPTRNPWDLERSTGGSSGGSAAAVAAGLVPLGHAGDGGGSIRIPASECGLVGLKPSRGRHSLGPELGEAWGGFVSRLVVSRSVRDTATVLDAVHGWMPGDPYTAPTPARPYVEELRADPPPLRIGFTTAAADPAVAVHPACGRAVLEAVRLLESSGHQVCDDRPAVLADAEAVAEFTGQFINLYSTWVASDVDELGRLSGTPVGPDGVEAGTWALAELGRSVTGVQYYEALQFCHRFTRRVAAWWADGFDILVTPTIPEPPPRLGEFAPTEQDPLRGLFKSAAIVHFTAPFNATGQPAISLPLAWHEGLPVGVQFVAPYGREDLLLSLAGQLERAAPWADRWPAVHA